MDLGEELRILIYQTAFLGDLILTSPLIKSVRKSFPDSQIFLVVRRGFEGVFSGFNYLNIIASEKSSPIKFSKVLRELDIDLAISPHRSHRTSLTLFLSGIPRRIGFNSSGFSFLYTDTVEHKFKRELHEVDRNLSLLEPLKEEFNVYYDSEPELPLNDSYVRKTLEKFSLEKPYVVLAPGSVWHTKAWIPEYYGEVALYLFKRGYQVVLVGSKSDAEYCLRAFESSKGKAINLCGRTSLKEFFSIIKGANLVVSNDSSPVHVAVSVKTPVVEIYGSTVPEFGFFPYGRGEIVELRGLKCRPCGIHGRRKCPEGHFKCMVDLKPEIVIERIEKIL
ncbi:heptosyltransferase-2 [Balnearium lithotrophicum]|uniref:lipopolysaccharide heptosyltransferase II n=1 Tax=Balnearium lithotrophicum TaxID=223788 RepID=A0A521ATR7_9BACT|nr:lipopolysaccharide heptosyltransferase II [Balnearium lithotrophicum]SMO38223.1 heptosyltransferase-2 [Balnearium lithotrophicum]